VQNLCGLDGLGEVCVEHILLKARFHPTESILRLGKMYTFGRLSLYFLFNFLFIFSIFFPGFFSSRHKLHNAREGASPHFG
jgi:hypothetical protein